MRAIKDVDKGYKALFENLEEAKRGAVVKAGIFAGPPRADSDGYSTAEIGAVHEFGLGTAPERSFIRATVDANKPAIENALRTIGKGIFKKQADIKVQLERFGLWFVGLVKQRIRDQIPPPLKAETIEHKGSSTPLIDKGILWSSLASKVEIGK